MSNEQITSCTISFYYKSRGIWESDIVCDIKMIGTFDDIGQSSIGRPELLLLFLNNISSFILITK